MKNINVTGISNEALEEIKKILGHDFAMLMALGLNGEIIRFLPDCVANNSVIKKDNGGEPVPIMDFIDVSLKVSDELIDAFPVDQDQFSKCETTMKIMSAGSWCIVAGKLKFCAGGC